MKISGVYKITNTITNDCYIGSSKDVKHRLAVHKCPSTWKDCPNKQLYLDMQKYGTDKFDFQILEEAEPEQLKEIEQQFIEKLHPVYNNNNAKGLDIEKKRKSSRKYMRKYHRSDRGRKTDIKARNKYNNQLCSYNGETITLNALSSQFYRAGIEHPTLEAKKYLLK